MDNEQILVGQVNHLALRVAQLEADKGELQTKVDYYEKREQQARLEKQDSDIAS